MYSPILCSCYSVSHPRSSQTTKALRRASVYMCMAVAFCKFYFPFAFGIALFAAFLVFEEHRQRYERDIGEHLNFG